MSTERIGILEKIKAGESEGEKVRLQISNREKKILNYLANEEGLTLTEYIINLCINNPYKNIFGGTEN